MCSRLFCCPGAVKHFSISAKSTLDFRLSRPDENSFACLMNKCSAVREMQYAIPIAMHHGMCHAMPLPGNIDGISAAFNVTKVPRRYA